ncbi:LytR/AlgR family response regulator transcription factor [Liquorilactobacillus mali]|uniref:Response regulator n=1 Tax=Liquorilactobacillus mali KCTC 3596 = DSM 20444 TaxID=1046596 RepID=A0A0R2DZA7_9LACO|nr:LytTR family transcriptional regulator DNA-binding domain-containing protein [Liquorilactobacillus mali]KRN09240.1 response regulator [Liquorilactobacillus mali KCTC 3596 = DSM 20444]MDC7952452.1 LytTR family transcriptional regulator DNA-binding domain-containing protein [Liquorilactobacillus mali]MDV7757416.1 response regulator [Liquorilactobacillus mali]
MNVLIIDDEPLARNELEFLLKQNIAVTTTYQAESIQEALDIILNKKVDLLFLDISLNNENGFKLANELNQLAVSPLVIFATAYSNYAVQAFDINAIDYILKPFEQTRINQAIKKAQVAILSRAEPKKETTISDKNRFISIPTEDRTVVIKSNEVVSAVTENGLLSIYTKDNTYVSHETLSWLREYLDQRNFVQVHRSSIVNINNIVEVQPWFNHNFILILTNKQRIPVGRSYLKSLKSILNM